LIKTLTRFGGIDKLDVLVTGSGVDTFNNNKFTLARVALGNSTIADITASVTQHMREAAYIRNGTPSAFDYTLVDGSTSRVTLATLLQKSTSSADFNRFSDYAKFSMVFYGGFDGTNIMDKNAATLNDRSTSTETRTADGEIGNAAAGFTSPGFSINQNGTSLDNATISSYRVAADIITDSIASNVNVLALPGQRDPLVTDYFADKNRDFGLALYVMDVPSYDSGGDRIWGGETTRYPDVEHPSGRNRQGRRVSEQNDSHSV